jgi:hypothetical protein
VKRRPSVLPGDGLARCRILIIHGILVIQRVLVIHGILVIHRLDRWIDRIKSCAESSSGPAGS